MKRPSFQFYPGDWLRDTALRSCSHGARGLWIDMLCLMHEGSPYGYLRVGKKGILPVTLAGMVGASLENVEGWLHELSEAEVFSSDASGTIFSRRMVRDEEIRAKRAAGGYKSVNHPNVHKPGRVSFIAPLVSPLDTSLDPPPSSSSSSSSSSAERESREVNSPSWEEVKHHAVIIGLPEWKAKDWFEEMEGCGWLDHQHRVIVNWRAVLARVRTRWEADGRPGGPTASRNGHTASGPRKEFQSEKLQRKKLMDDRIKELRSVTAPASDKDPRMVTTPTALKEIEELKKAIAQIDAEIIAQGRS